MQNSSGPSIFIPSDKNIFDALQHKKVRHSEALKFLRNRGILVSSKLDKTELSKIISQLVFDYHDYLNLTKLLENPSRKEKTTQATIKASTNQDNLVKACQNIDKSETSDESYKVIKKENSTVLVVTYTDIDFTKTELRQRSIKKCEIELQSSGDETTVRMPATKKGREIADKVKLSLSKIVGEELEEEVISLENFVLPEARSLFFDELIKSISGYRLEDVSSVDVYHKIDNLEDNLDEESENESSSYAGFIQKAALAEGGVLESTEFNQLHSRGFFICKIVWTVVDIHPGGDIVELEAQFGTPSSCTDFKYLVRGVRHFNERIKTQIVTKRAPSRLETNVFNNHLEKAAKLAFDKIVHKYAEPENEDN